MSQLVEAAADAVTEQELVALLEDADLPTVRHVLRQMVLDVAALKARVAQRKP